LFLKFKKIIQDRYKISPVSLKIMRYSLKISIFILILALIIEVYCGEFTARTYYFHYLSAELYRMPLSLLLTSFIISAVINNDLNL
jgi:hypothetical protein